jgi:hypothetical protein
MSVTYSIKEPEPIEKMTFPEYFPGLSFAIKFDAVMVTLVGAPPFRLLRVGLALSQVPPESVSVDADHAPIAPQFVIVTVCGCGSLWLAIPVKLSEPGVPVMQPA